MEGHHKQVMELLSAQVAFHARLLLLWEELNTDNFLGRRCTDGELAAMNQLIVTYKEVLRTTIYAPQQQPQAPQKKSRCNNCFKISSQDQENFQGNHERRIKTRKYNFLLLSVIKNPWNNIPQDAILNFIKYIVKLHFLTFSTRATWPYGLTLRATLRAVS